MSVGKELYKKVLARPNLHSAHLECLWRLTPAFPSIDAEQARAFLSRILKAAGVADVQAVRAMAAVFRRAQGVEKVLMKKIVGRVLELLELTESHLRLLGAIIACGAEEAVSVVSSLQKWLARTSGNPAIQIGFQQILHRFPAEPIVSALVRIAVSEDTLREAVSLCKQPEHLFATDSLTVYKAWAQLINSHPQLHMTDVLRFCEIASRHSQDGGLEHIGTIISTSIARSRDSHLLLGRLLAAVKTAKLLHPESFEAHLYLLDATLEALAGVDPLWLPYGLLQEVQDWAQSIHCNALLPSLTRLHPRLFDAGMLDSLTVEERIDALYSMAHHDRAFEYRPWLEVKLEGLGPHHLDRLAYLILQCAPELGRIDLPLQYLASTAPQQSSVVKLFTAMAPGMDPTLLLSRLALLPKKARETRIFLQVLLATIRTLNDNHLDDDSRRFILDAVQAHLIPFYPLEEHHTALAEIMQSLCGIGGEPFRAALTRSLIQQSVDYALPVAIRCAYIHILGHVADGLGAAGVLLSIAKDLARPRAQAVAAQSLAQLLVGSVMPGSLTESLGDLIWSLSCDGRSEGLSSLLLAYATAIAPDCSLEHPSVRLLFIALTHALEMVQVTGLPRDTNELLEACTHVLLTWRTVPGLPLLLDLIDMAISQGHVEAGVECLRWVVEFRAEERPLIATTLLPALLPLDLPKAQSTITTLLLLLEPAVSVNLLFAYGCPATLIRYLPCLQPSNELASRGFQKAMELVSSPEPAACKQGLALLLSLIAVLKGEASDEKAILTGHQPHILAAFGLACHHEHPLVRSQAYLALSELIAVDFHGLGIAEHPRLDRLLTAAFPASEEGDAGTGHWPELACQLARFVMVAAWAAVLRHPRLGTRFPLPDPLLFATEARAAIMAFNRGVTEYRVDNSELRIGYELAVQSCSALLLINTEAGDEAIVRIALDRPARESLLVLALLAPTTVPESDLQRYLIGAEPCIELLDLLKHLESPRWAIPLLVTKVKDTVDEDVLLRLVEYMAPCQEYDMAVMSLMDKSLPLRTLLLRLKTFLAHIQETERFAVLFSYLLAWTSVDEHLATALQTLAFALTFKPASIPASSPIIKSTVKLFTSHSGNPVISDCLALVLCKGQDMELKRVLAAKVLPLVTLTDSKRDILAHALQELL